MNRKSVLVVEDDLDIRNVVELTLQGVGYRVTTASEGREALACVEQEMPGAIVLDLKMPGMNGWEFAQIFHGRYGKSAPIMVLTAARAASQHAAQIGAEGYLDKPFEIADLVREVERLLQAPQAAPSTAAPSADRADEAAILQQAIAGDPMAFQWLYERYARGIYRYLYYRLGNLHDAEDLAQQVFLKAWSKIGDYRHGRSPFSSWLLTIARNHLVSFYRRQRQSQSLDDPALRSALLDDRADLDPLGAVEVQMQHDAMQAALNALTPVHRQVILLRFVLNLPHREIAAALNRSEGAVRVLQVRALRKLHRILEESGNGW